jgi:hypothetical protein
MDMRTARTLTGNEGVAMMDIYEVNREEMRIGPFRQVFHTVLPGGGTDLQFEMFSGLK